MRGILCSTFTIQRRSSNASDASPLTASATRSATDPSDHEIASSTPYVQPATACVSAMTVKAVTLRPTRAPAERASPTWPAACQIAPGMYLPSWATSSTAAWSSRLPSPSRVAHASAAASNPTPTSNAAPTRRADRRQLAVRVVPGLHERVREEGERDGDERGDGDGANGSPCGHDARASKT